MKSLTSVRRGWLAALLTIALCTRAQADSIRVGMYHFPPFAEVEVQGAAVTGLSGLAVDLIGLMNAFQSEFRFEPVATSPARRVLDFEAGYFDMIMFEDFDWASWKEQPVDASQVFLTGGELYIAAAVEGRDQSFFADFRRRRMIGVRGYHYGFADFNADPVYLQRHFDMRLTSSGVAAIRMILAGGRGDIAVVNKSLLNRYLRDHPEVRQKLLISTTYDQRYAHTMLLRRGSKLDIARLDALLDALREAGVMRPLWDSVGRGEEAASP
ncbi:MAG: substrate-binding periplasmic protein [Gammaproteobacteria bacterium]